jgi:hypothetical protein
MKVTDLRLDADQSPRRYRIPSYQRGYRWTVDEVTQLLEDVNEFRSGHRSPEEFYCLQPIVLLPKPGTGESEVVDGQQRLTTLLLILRHFNEWAGKRGQLQLYTLSYDTRPGLDAFLDNPSDEEALTNIDYFHIRQASKTIEAWFDARATELEDIKHHFLNRTKVIWFELSDTERPVAAFTRLNVGKIPLTNGELIRGLLLRKAKTGDSESLQLRIAYEWDLIEKSLQRAEFWHFLTNKPAPEGNRIDLIFEIVATQRGHSIRDQPYSVFSVFSTTLNQPQVDVQKEWNEVKRVVMLLEEWFENRTLFHLVGFLVCEGRDISRLLRMTCDRRKSEFTSLLLAECRRALNLPENAEGLRTAIEERLSGLRYPKHSRQIRSFLLLFNVATLLSNKLSNLRFQFDSYKDEEGHWDIEHVRSQAQFPERERDQKAWLEPCLDYLRTDGTEDDAALITEINAWLNHPGKSPRPAFEPLYRTVRERFRESDETDDETHQIGNLALLDEGTNRSYKNATFALKRRRVLALDRDGIFIPLCTRSVFLKCYNPKADSLLFWAKQDRDSYRNAIIDMLHDFFIGGWIE